MLDTISLSDKQKTALHLIEKWQKSDEQCFVLAGYAGSGKSTLARHIGKIYPEAVFCAYTGKAAHVLRAKGCYNASTIHGLMYKYQGKNHETGELIFGLKSGGQAFAIVDEYSMVDQKTIDDLKSKVSKILFIGDPAQLPPVKEKAQILKPDFFLDEIHRQAMENPIVKWAHEIRSGRVPKSGTKDGNFSVISMKDVDENELTKYEQVIVGKNQTKRQLNLKTREMLGYSDIGNIPVRGDKMICLQNNHKEDLYNGMIFEAEEAAKKWENSRQRYELFVDGKYRNVWDGDVLGKDAKGYEYGTGLDRFDYAYAITCHKAQGSEFDSTLVFNEAWGPDYINWLYTAVTRAKNKCTLIAKD